jgi:hypothetical protein
MLAATRAILLQFHATGIVTAIFLGRVIALFAFGTRQGNYRADIFLRSHINLPRRKIAIRKLAARKVAALLPIPA